MKKSTVLPAAVLGGIVVLNLVVLWARGEPAAQPPAAEPVRPPTLAAGPGRVEPISEEISIGAQVSGRLQAVFIEEGDRVGRGQVVAVIENQDHLARVRSAEAELRLKKAELRRVINGARDQERREAEATLAEAEAVLDNARSELRRRQSLLKEGVISRGEADGAERQARVAQARADAARERYSLLDADAREEDRDGAESEVALAQARLDEARALWDKTFVRAPIPGVVLRKHRNVGESVSTEFNSPIVTIADRSALRVRVDVDEVDVSKIAVGQHAYVTADAFDGIKFWGRVVRVGQLLGKKNIRTDEPAERVDTKILEVLVQLDDGHELPLGLRVQAFIVGRTLGGSSS
jgi:ABC exporter DevB family membrane fusion protein